MKRHADAPGWRQRSDRFAATRPHFRRRPLIDDLVEVGGQNITQRKKSKWLWPAPGGSSHVAGSAGTSRKRCIVISN